MVAEDEDEEGGTAVEDMGGVGARVIRGDSEAGVIIETGGPIMRCLGKVW